MISIIGKIFESSFLTNLFEDLNVARILYKSSQICGMHTKRRQLNRDGGSINS